MACSPTRLASFVLGASLCFAGMTAVAADSEPRVPDSYTLREWHEQEGIPTDELAGVMQDDAC